MRLLLVTAFVLWLAIPASAQPQQPDPMTVAVTELTSEEHGRMKVEVAKYRATANVTLDCRYLLEGGRVSVAVDGPDYGQIVAHTVQKSFTQGECGTGTQIVEFPFSVVLSREAPAFKIATFYLNFTAEQILAGQLRPLDTEARILQGTIDYLPIMEYKPEIYLAKSHPGGHLRFPIKVVNFGNGASKVATEISAVTRGLDVIGPIITNFDSRIENGPQAINEGLLVLEVAIPEDAAPKIYLISVAFHTTSIHEGDDVMIDKQTMTLSVQVTGGGLAQAGALDAPLVVLALAAAIVFHRR